MSLHYIHHSEIKIPEYRQRRYFDPAKHQELIESIQHGAAGLMHPVVLRAVGSDWFLVAGERRFRAIQDIYELGGTFKCGGETVAEGMIPYTPVGELSTLEAIEAELDENLRRANLTWQEEAEAIARLADLRAEQTGLTPKQLTADIAEELEGNRQGRGFQTVRNSLIVAKHLDNEAVRKAKTLDEAVKILKKEERAENYRALAQEAVAKKLTTLHKLHHADSLDWMKTQPAEQFDVILTDPPYGMGADTFGDSNGMADGAHGYADSADYLTQILEVLAPESFRLAKQQAHLYCFCDIDHFFELRESFRAAGWTVFRTPLIWHKPSGMRAPWPEQGPQRKYETLLYAVKGGRRVNHIDGDVITVSSEANLGHAAQKPVELLVNLLARSTRPGDKILDPFCGTGGIFTAAHARQCVAVGVERDETFVGIATSRIQQLDSQEELPL